MPLPEPISPSSTPADAFRLFELGWMQSATTTWRPTLPAENALQEARWKGAFSWLYQTPEPWRTQLTDHQAALWCRAGAWALSTKVASILLGEPPAAGALLDFQTVHPAKSEGFLMLSVGDLVLYDTYNSPVLPQLLHELLARTAATPRYFESYDC